MVIGSDGRKKSHTFHRILMRSAAKLNYAQAQAAFDGQPHLVVESISDWGTDAKVASVVLLSSLSKDVGRGVPEHSFTGKAIIVSIL